MRHPIFVRPLTAEEQRRLAAGRHSADAFTVRRSQILLASSRGETVARIAEFTGLSDQAVRNALRDFDQRGLEALTAGSSRPKSVVPVLSGERQERLEDLLHHSPREYGKERSLWTLPLLAEVSFQEGLTPEMLSGESVRRALKRLQVNWRRAKRWVSSPDPLYGLKKTPETD
jgi:transposase